MSESLSEKIANIYICRCSVVSRYSVFILVVCFGVSLSVYWFVSTMNLEHERLMHEFSGNSGEYIDHIREAVNHGMHDISALSSFYEASEKVERGEFREFAGHMLMDNPSLQAVEWVPRVSDSERAAYEGEAVNEGIASFKFRESNTQGVMVKAGQRTEYFPVYYVEPLEGNVEVLGFDLGSDPTLSGALAESRDSGKTAATRRITPVQDNEEKYSFLLMHPVYPRGVTPGTVEDRRISLLGFVIGVYSIGDLVKEASGLHGVPEFDIHLFDQTAPTGAEFLAVLASPQHKENVSHVKDPDLLMSGKHHAETIEVGGRKWVAICTPLPDFPGRAPVWKALKVFAPGVLVTGFLAGYILLAIFRVEDSRRHASEILRAKEKLEREAAERRNAEEMIMQSEEKYRQITETSTEGICRINLSGEFIFTNDAFIKQFGYEREDLPEKKFTELVVESELPRAIELFERIVSGESIRDELTFRRKDGSEFSGYLSAAPIRQEEVISGLTGMLSDLTSLKRAEEALRESRNLLFSLIDNIPAVIYIKDIGGRFMLVNRVTEESLGQTRERLIGKTSHDVQPVEIADTFVENDRKVLAEGKELQFEEQAIFGGQTRTYLSYKFPLKDDNGEAYAVCGISIDITERKNAEEALRLQAEELARFNDELERSNEELEEFAYVASHDLKEPLRGIHNYSRFLLEDYGDRLEEDGRSKLETLGRLTQRMEKLIEMLLEYSRLGRVNLAIEETDLNSVLCEVLASLQIRLTEENIDVRIPKTLPTVRCDRVRIAQIFRNLITNAIKYNDKPDKWVEIGFKASKGEMTCPIFHVRDNGIGIIEKHHEIIFRIFKRLHGRDRYGGGTGAGLTIVRKILKRHGGDIWVDSSLGEGTTFYFTFEGRSDDAAGLEESRVRTAG